MHWLSLGAEPSRSILTSPDMTVNEAAEAMERSHLRQVLVGREGLPMGILSEEDIVSKVLARGLDPNLVHVEDIMAPGRLAANGSMIIDDDADGAAPLWAAETLTAREDDDNAVLFEILAGRCEECGVFSDQLHDHEGLEMCPECSGFRSALFG